MAISNLVLTQQTYSEETNGAHAHYREPVTLRNPEQRKLEFFCADLQLNLCKFPKFISLTDI